MIDTTRELSEIWDVERMRDYAMVISILTNALLYREQISEDNIELVHYIMALTEEHHYCSL